MRCTDIVESKISSDREVVMDFCGLGWFPSVQLSRKQEFDWPCSPFPTPAGLLASISYRVSGLCKSCDHSVQLSQRGRSYIGRDYGVEELWRWFFSDPSQWWDHRFDKRNPNYPDFKHKHTKDVLWVDRRSNPNWVQEKLSALTEGAVPRSVFSWNCMISRHIKIGQFKEAVKLFAHMQSEHVQPDKFTFARVVNACAGMMALETGRMIHEQLITGGFQSDVTVASALIDMYAKCGSIRDAEIVFRNMRYRDVVCWNAMILGYAKSGVGEKALKLYGQMQLERIVPDTITFVGGLNACASVGALEEGRNIHAQIIESACELNDYVGGALVDMYAKCGSIKEALSVFHNMHTRDVVCWNAMIMGFVKCGFGQRALELYEQMQLRQLKPDRVTYVAVLNACASIGALERGRHIHSQIVETGYECDDFVSCSLLDMYAKCGSIEEAFKIFERMENHGVVYWTSMIVGFVKCGNGKRALELYEIMQLKCIEADRVTFVAVLNACASVGAVEVGRRVHADIIKHGYESDYIAGTALVDMYAKCGSIDDACRAFSNLQRRDVVSWTALIVGYVKSGNWKKALDLYKLMQLELVDPNTLTFVGLLNACASLAALEEGKEIHKQIRERGCESDDFVVSALIDMYAKCGNIAEACMVFDNLHTPPVVCWTTMIMGYVKCGLGEKALQVYKQMELENVKPDSLTFVGALNACASLEALEEGKCVHRAIIQSGCHPDDFVGSALIDMYAKSGSIEDASKVFDGLHTRSLACWNALIAGFAKCGNGRKALELFDKMQMELVEPDIVTFLTVLNACASVAALAKGRHIHSQIIKVKLESDDFICSSLVDMYAKCGIIEEAQKVFIGMHSPSLVCWTAMVRAYAMHGQGKEAIRLFEQMKQDYEVSDIAFVCLLSACSHACLLDEGHHYYESMDSVYGIAKTEEHYACMVDLLGRSGLLGQAESMIYSMPSGHRITAWSALLGACRIHGNLELGERVAKKVIDLDPESASAYVLLSNIYAAAGKWEKCELVHNMRVKRQVHKQPGCTWIEVNNQVHSFMANDTSHSQTKEIHTELMRLSGQLKQAGYVSDESFLCLHSERLAIAYGLISSPPGSPIHILKNLRVCVDCHTATKFISKVVGRLIVVRDANRFHHVKDGVCSCGGLLVMPHYIGTHDLLL